jgi:very-short-patch-repair endonuclease
MHRRTTPKVFAHSKELRHHTTPAEQLLWKALRVSQPEGVHFRRQHAIGHYIVDFCAARQKLIIELDGSQHLELEAYDRERTEFLQARGYRVLRFWNNDVTHDLNGVVQVILEALNNPVLS